MQILEGREDGGVGVDETIGQVFDNRPTSPSSAEQ